MTAPDPRLEEIETRLSKATPGPWEARQDFIDGGVPDNSMTLNGGGRGDYIGTIALHYDVRAANAKFIAHAPTDVSYLLAELRKAQDKLARVEGLARSSKPLQGMGGMYSGIVMADHILAAVADATGGGES